MLFCGIKGGGIIGNCPIFDLLFCNIGVFITV